MRVPSASRVWHHLATKSSSRLANYCCILSMVILLVVESNSFAQQTSASHQGMAVTGSPYASQAGAEILEQGGNAVDAAVASAFALVVAEPGECGLGGRTVMLVCQPDGKKFALDGATRWPQRWTQLRTEGATIKPPLGWGQIAVPGTLAALFEAHKRWGKLPWSKLLHGAIHLAQDGFIVSTVQGDLFAKHAWGADATLRHIFLHPDGKPYRAGELLRQPELAYTLRLIARHGPDIFYKGAIAEAIAQQMEQQAGYVSLKDLADYRVLPAPTDEIVYHKYRIVAVDRPAQGRSLLWHLRVLALLPVFNDRADDVQALAELLANEPPKGTAGETDSVERDRLIKGDSVEAAANTILHDVTDHKASFPPPPSPMFVTNTTHLVTIDRAGQAVSLTQSLGPVFGANVALPDYGITFAATMNYLDDVDMSLMPTSAIVPTLILDADGKPKMTLGAAGALLIPGVILQVVHNVLDRNMPLADAVAAPRISISQDKGRSRVLMEDLDNQVNDPLRASLHERGIEIASYPKGQALGRVHALMRQADGTWIGVADPRWFGNVVSPIQQNADPLPLKTEKSTTKASVPAVRYWQVKGRRVTLWPPPAQTASSSVQSLSR